MNKNIEKLHEKYLVKMYAFLKKKGFILEEELIEKQYEENEKLLNEFLNWLETKKKVTKQALEIHGMNINAFLLDLLNYGKCSVFNMLDSDLLSFVLDRYIRKHILPISAQKKLLKSLLVFFNFLSEKYNIDLMWAKEWCIRVKRFYLNQLKVFKATSSSGLLWDKRHYDWQAKSMAYLAKYFLLPPPLLDDNIEWGGYMGPIESLLLDYYTKLLVDFIRKIDPKLQMPPEKKYGIVIQFQRTWAKTPITEVDNKTPLELIKLERKLYRMKKVPFF